RAARHAEGELARIQSAMEGRRERKRGRCECSRSAERESGALAPACHSFEPMRIRVVCWNIHKGIGGVDRRYDLDRIIDAILEQEADIVLLQEVAEGMPQLRFEDQAWLLSERLEMPHLDYGPEHRFSRGGYGNVILSRYPLTDIHHIDLRIGNRKKRGVISARTHVRMEGHTRSVVLFNLHLGLAGSERAEQLSRFLQCDPF